MARFEGTASIRRALSLPDGRAQLDIKPDGLDWQWSFVPAERARPALALAIAAISGGWKLYLSLPDDVNSPVLEVIGLSNTPDRPTASAGSPGSTAHGRLHVTISPTPQMGMQHVYTVTVKDSSTNKAPEPPAAVTLHNFTQHGAPAPKGPLQTNVSGEVPLDNVALYPRITWRGYGDNRERVFVSPTLEVTADGYAPVSLTLLEDTGDV